jgi:hypothetical protein
MGEEGRQMGKKYFTAREANDALPYVIEDMRRLREAKSSFIEKLTELKTLRSRTAAGSSEELSDRIFRLETELEFLQMEAKTLMASIELKGAELKDLDLGLVDFPGIVDGEEVLLCWKMGEPHIAYYHGLTEGYRGRRPLPEVE